MLPPPSPRTARCRLLLAVVLAAALVLLARDARAEPVTPGLLGAVQPRFQSSGSWVWPITPVGLVRDYQAPPTEYGRGHRGIDVRASAGAPVGAVAAGTVSFVGQVAGTEIISVTHAGGWISTYLPVISRVSAGALVKAGEIIGAVSPDTSHCLCLHLGARFFGEYVSPLVKLGRVPRSVLKPW